jgi:hypothetical protein
MLNHAPLVLVVLLGAGGLIVGLRRSKKRLQSAKSRSVWDYLFLWPLILDQPVRRERVAAGGSFFTTRESVGIAVFVAILVIGLTFF